MMKAIILVVALVVVVALADAQSSNIDCSNLQPTDDAAADYQNLWQCHFPNQPVDNDPERLAKFHKCRSDSKKHNSVHSNTHTTGLTRFCGMTDAEINKTRNHKLNQPGSNAGTRSVASAIDFDLRATTSLPVNFSWVSSGAVSPVKNQGNCGNCYTFAAAGAVEGAYKIKHGVLYNLSSEQYTDCSTNYGACLAYSQSCMGSTCTTTYFQYWAASVSWGNAGCDGGTYEACWAYNNMTGLGLTSMSCYPLTSDASGVSGTCTYSSSCPVQVKVSNYVAVPAGDEVTLQKVIATIGPVACSLDATVLETYTGGIIPAINSTDVNHAILVVGYGTTLGGVNYWTVKNSWGTYWGQQGYFQIVRGFNSLSIASGCAYPIVA